MKTNRPKCVRASVAGGNGYGTSAESATVAAILCAIGRRLADARPS